MTFPPIGPGCVTFGMTARQTAKERCLPHLLPQAHSASWRQNPPPSLQLVKEILSVTIWWERVCPVLIRRAGVSLTGTLLTS